MKETKKRLKGLRDLEKRTYLKWHRDGITDLGLGVLVLLFGIGMKYDQTLLAPIYGCLGYPIWLILKQRITEKRLGYVEFGEARKNREKRGWIWLFVLGCLVLFLGIMAYMTIMQKGTSGLTGIPGYLLISVIFAVLISSVGVVLELGRLHLYSILILFMGLAGHFLQWQPETGIILPGSLIVIFGFVLFITFLKKYPVVDPEPELIGGDGEKES